MSGHDKGLCCKGRLSGIDGSDVSELPPVPADREFTWNGLYSWAYHKYEVLGRKLHGYQGEVLKAHCRAKAQRIMQLHGHICIAKPCKSRP